MMRPYFDKTNVCPFCDVELTEHPEMSEKKFCQECNREYWRE